MSRGGKTSAHSEDVENAPAIATTDDYELRICAVACSAERLSKSHIRYPAYVFEHVIDMKVEIKNCVGVDSFLACNVGRPT